MNDIDLGGRRAVITGGARGIGLAVAERFLASGATVTLWDRDPPALDAATKRLAAGDKVHTVRADVADDASVAAAANATIGAMGGIDILVNNAGITGPNATTWEYPVAEWKRVMDVDLTGPFLCCRAVVPVMLKAGYGRIVNIASVAGLGPTGSSIAYAVSKAGLIHLTKCMAVALAPEVLVNCVAPGLLEGTRATANLRPEVVAKNASVSLLGKPADKDDCADQVVTMCRTNRTTGQTLVIDSGRVFH